MRTKRFVTIYLVFLASSTMIAWIVALPPTFEKYSSISILSQNMTASGYFLDNSSTVIPSTLMLWNAQVYNHMGTVQLVSLIVKVSNQTIPGPDAVAGSPSSGVVLLRLTKAAFQNETWTVPVQWLIVNATRTSMVTIETMQVNNQTTTGINVSSGTGKNFRLIFELWTYDLETHSFVFSFVSDGILQSIWDQLWFDV